MPRLVAAARGTGLIALSVRPDGGALAAAAPYTGVRIVDPTTLREVAANDQVPVARCGSARMVASGGQRQRVDSVG